MTDILVYILHQKQAEANPARGGLDSQKMVIAQAWKTCWEQCHFLLVPVQLRTAGFTEHYGDSKRFPSVLVYAFLSAVRKLCREFDVSIENSESSMTWFFSSSWISGFGVATQNESMKYRNIKERRAQWGANKYRQRMFSNPLFGCPEKHIFSLHMIRETDAWQGQVWFFPYSFSARMSWKGSKTIMDGAVEHYVKVTRSGRRWLDCWFVSVG